MEINFSVLKFDSSTKKKKEKKKKRKYFLHLPHRRLCGARCQSGSSVEENIRIS
jgi:hypothetical protein